MKERKVISFVLLAAYMLAMAVNACVVLTCDCASRHHRMHACCAEMCEAVAGTMSLTQHCACTHSHENRAADAVVSDTDRTFKSLRAVVAELPRMFVWSAEPDDAGSVETVFYERHIIFIEACDLSVIAPRAPSVMA